MTEPASTPTRDPPLHAAARSADLARITELLAAGARPDDRDDDGRTALFHVGSAAVARALLAAGADLHSRDGSGRDALQHLLELGDWQIEHHQGQARYRTTRVEVARVLIEAGADLEQRSKDGSTRLYLVAFGRDPAMIEFLLAAGADPRARDATWRSPLHAVSWWGGPDPNFEGEDGDVTRVIDLLVAAGVPIDETDEEGSTPLHEAAGGDWGCPEAIRALLRLGAPVDARDRRGRTPLMLAAEYDGPECVRLLLLAAGANPTLTDLHDWNALDHARDPGERFVDEADREPPDREGPGSGDNPECVRLLAPALRQWTARRRRL